MKGKTFLILAFTLISLLTFASFSSAPRKLYSFQIILPEIVEGRPGETVVVKGGILNTGLYWLKMFNITLSGLPYEYEIEPSFFEYVRILREWSPEKGVYRVPVNFTIKIKLPQNALGAHLVNVTGIEGSWRKVSASSVFILRVLANITVAPNVTVSELMLPESIRANETFNLTFKINNFEPIDLRINASVFVPEGWEVEKTKTVLVRANSSEKVSFRVTPSTTSGNVNVYLEYPYGVQTFNLTKYGAFLIPETEIPKVEEAKEVPIVGKVVEAIKGISPIILAIIILLLAIIFWNLVKIYHFYRKRRKPEKFEKEKKKTESQIQSSQTL